MAKVALFGFYKAGNFGDDLMAIMYGIHLKNAGHEAVVYGLSPALADEFELLRADNLDDLMDGVDCAVVGGGGILVLNRSPRGSKFQNFREEIFRFVTIAEAKKIPIAAYSIGGSELSDFSSPVHLGLAKLLLSPQLKDVTIRRAEDLPMFECLGLDVHVVPDVVLALTDVLPVQQVSREDKQLVIGLNLWDRPSDKVLVLFLTILSKFNKRLKVVFLNTYLEGNESGEADMLGRDIDNNISYVNLRPYLQTLSGIDLLISCKLHLCVAAITLGVPAVSWGGTPKAQSFFKSVDFEDGIISSDRKSRLAFMRKMLSTDTYISSLRERMTCVTRFMDGAGESLRRIAKFADESR